MQPKVFIDMISSAFIAMAPTGFANLTAKQTIAAVTAAMRSAAAANWR